MQLLDPRISGQYPSIDGGLLVSWSAPASSLNTKRPPLKTIWPPWGCSSPSGCIPALVACRPKHSSPWGCSSPSGCSSPWGCIRALVAYQATRTSARRASAVSEQATSFSSFPLSGLAPSIHGPPHDGLSRWSQPVECDTVGVCSQAWLSLRKYRRSKTQNLFSATNRLFYKKSQIDLFS